MNTDSDCRSGTQADSVRLGGPGGTGGGRDLHCCWPARGNFERKSQVELQHSSASHEPEIDIWDRSMSRSTKRLPWSCALPSLFLLALALDSLSKSADDDKAGTEAVLLLTRQQGLKQSLLCKHRPLSMRVNARMDAKSLSRLIGEMSSDADQDEQEAIHSSEIAASPGIVQRLIEAEIKIIKGEQKEIMDVKRNLLTHFDSPSCYELEQFSSFDKASMAYLRHRLRAEIHQSIQSYLTHLLLRRRNADDKSSVGLFEQKHQYEEADLARGALDRLQRDNATSSPKITTLQQNAATMMKDDYKADPVERFQSRPSTTTADSSTSLLWNLFGNRERRSGGSPTGVTSSNQNNDPMGSNQKTAAKIRLLRRRLAEDWKYL